MPLRHRGGYGIKRPNKTTNAQRAPWGGMGIPRRNNSDICNINNRGPKKRPRKHKKTPIQDEERKKTTEPEAPGKVHRKREKKQTKQPKLLTWREQRKRKDHQKQLECAAERKTLINMKKWPGRTEHSQLKPGLDEGGADAARHYKKQKKKQDTYCRHPRNTYRARSNLHTGKLQSHYHVTQQERNNRSCTRRNINNAT